jgi:hypothetical protein
MKIVPPNVKKVNKSVSMNDDMLPFERPLKVVLRIYAKRWLIWWLIWLLVVAVCLVPLVILWMVR